MSQWAREHVDEDYDEHFGLPRLPRYGSYDLGLANPPEELPDSAPCRCGHTLEDHSRALGCRAEASGPGADGDWVCWCSAFELDD